MVFQPFTGGGGTRAEMDFCFDSGMFRRDSRSYCGGLAYISALACAACYNARYENEEEWAYELERRYGGSGFLGLGGKQTWIVAFLKQLGFENVETYNYHSGLEPKKASVHTAFAIASRDIDDFTVIAVCVRGTTGGEWLSNFDMDKKRKRLTGFVFARDELMTALESYIERKVRKGRRLKLWATGHSRGGAAANLLCGALNREGGVFHPSDIYCVTFASPNCSFKAEPFENIYNFVAPSDFVTFVPPREWGCSRYGLDIAINKKERPVTYRRSLDYYSAITGRPFEGFSGPPLEDKPVRTFVEEFARKAPSMDVYIDGDGKTSNTCKRFFDSVAEVLSGGDAFDAMNFLNSGGLDKSYLAMKMFCVAFGGINPCILAEHSPEAYIARVMAVNQTLKLQSPAAR